MSKAAGPSYVYVYEALKLNKMEASDKVSTRRLRRQLDRQRNHQINRGWDEWEKGIDVKTNVVVDDDIKLQEGGLGSYFFLDFWTVGQQSHMSYELVLYFSSLFLFPLFDHLRHQHRVINTVSSRLRYLLETI